MYHLQQKIVQTVGQLSTAIALQLLHRNNEYKINYKLSFICIAFIFDNEINVVYRNIV